ncbi:MAG TPA: hypothetical protein VK550_24500 [Polyangiaceae bacterium]|nr:hypothetical protein [Polyangiaceae bacterium]
MRAGVLRTPGGRQDDVAVGRKKLASSPSAQRIGPRGSVLAPDRLLEYALI